MRPLMSEVLPAPSTIVVLSLSTVIFLAWPRSLRFIDSRSMPSSSMIGLPPARIAMSSSMALRRSPKPGALTAQTFRTPRSLFTTSVARASPSMSSAMMSSDFPLSATLPRMGSRSLAEDIFFSCTRT